jgi:RNA polymerase sigma factor for flagellar operon FliA
MTKAISTDDPEAVDCGEQAPGGSIGQPAMLSTEPERVGTELSRIVRGLAGRLYARLPRGCGIEMADLIQAGNVGLVKATNKFEESYGAPLAGYARFRIRGEMLDMVRRNAERDNAGAAGRGSNAGTPDLESQIPASPDSSPQQSVLRRQRSEIIWEELQRLPPRYQAVIRLRYSREMTLREIGDELNVNESRACQLHQLALTRLKRALSNRGVRDFSHL